MWKINKGKDLNLAEDTEKNEKKKKNQINHLWLDLHKLYHERKFSSLDLHKFITFHHKAQNVSRKIDPPRNKPNR